MVRALSKYQMGILDGSMQYISKVRKELELLMSKTLRKMLASNKWRRQFLTSKNLFSILNLNVLVTLS